VDAGFGGKVAGLTVDATYGAHTITLNRDLEVDGAASLGDATGRIDGGSQLLIGDANNTVAGSLNWTAGTLKGTGNTNVVVNTQSTCTIGGPGAKTIDGRFVKLNGISTWDGQSDILLQNSAILGNFGTFDYNSQGGVATVNGNNEPATEFINGNNATLNITAGDANSAMDCTAKVTNYNLVHVIQGAFETNAILNAGTITVDNGCLANLGQNAAAVTLDSTVVGAHPSILNGTGMAQFRPNCTVQVVGIVNVANVTDDSASVTVGNGAQLQVNGAYTWSPGVWTGGGTVQIGTNTAQLRNYYVERHV